MGLMTRRTLLAGTTGLVALTGAACAVRQATSSGTGGSGQADAGDAEPLQSFDMHADTVDLLGMKAHTPYSIADDVFDGTLVSTNAQVSADRIAGMRWVQCYAVWIPDDKGEEKGDIPAIQWYREAVAWFKDQMRQHADRFEQVATWSDIPSILDAGKVAAVLTVENAACLSEGIEVVDEFAADGVLMAGITWNYKNALGSGNEYPKVGLTDLGKQYIAALEQRGIVVDVSHINEKGFWDVEEVATKPYVASHSNARAVCNHLRNLTDEQFAAIVARGGLVGLNFHDAFVHDGGHVYTFDDLAAHVEHWLDKGGENVIAFGSDRDGADIPTWLADCANQGYLFERFADRLGAEVAKKLFFDNALRFFGGVTI